MPCILWQDTCGCGSLQEQRSAWNVEELRKLEFKVRGINGWKGGRGITRKASGQYSRTYLWTKISDLTQKITYYYPKMALQLLATKQMNHGVYDLPPIIVPLPELDSPVY